MSVSDTWQSSKEGEDRGVTHLPCLAYEHHPAGIPHDLPPLLLPLLGRLSTRVPRELIPAFTCMCLPPGLIAQRPGLPVQFLPLRTRGQSLIVIIAQRLRDRVRQRQAVVDDPPDHFEGEARDWTSREIGRCCGCIRSLCW